MSVELEGGSSEPTEGTPQSSGTEATEQTSQAPEPLDLDSVPKFRYAGREWTPKDLQGAVMMQSDYTRKTQALAEERKYYDNLSADLEAVKKNPSLAEQFRRVYPEKYHSYLGHVIPQQAQSQANQQPGIDPKFEDRFNKLESWYNSQTQKAADSEVSANCEKFASKYPTVKGQYESLALGMLANHLQELQKANPDAKLSEQDWERAFKQIHDLNQKTADSLYAEKVNKQKLANLKGRDAAVGGGIPGQAPRTPRTIKEASAFALQELENS